MSSIINYRFKSYKNFSKIFFEGESLSLWEIKYEIISQRKMNSKDFDLLFYDADSGERIEDEYLKIEKNSRLVIERIPIWMSDSKGTAEFKQKMTGYARTPPDSYTCFKCGQKGHYIQHCPNTEDKLHETIIQRVPSGVPKEYINKDDQIISVRPQTQEWKKQINLIKYNNIPDKLKCTECKGLLTEPQKSSCKHFFCKGCAYQDERCPQCRKTILFLKYSPEKEREITKYTSRT